MLNFASATLVRERFEAEPFLTLGLEELAPAFTLTLDEALKVAETLQALVATARKE